MAFEATAVRSITVRFKQKVFATTEIEKHEQQVELDKIVSVLLSGSRWTLFAAAHESVDGKPGDCLFLPPAVLLDLDDKDRREARRWRLALGRLTEPDSGEPFLHCWLEVCDTVVSVSNLRRGYPAYATARRAYYEKNGLVGEVDYVSARSLRYAARRLGGGSALAKWLAGRSEPTDTKSHG